MSDISLFLGQLGLTAPEQSVYLAGLRTGPALAQRIAREAKLSRTLVYYILKQLEDRGLVSRDRRSSGQLFAVEGPSRLQTLLERKRDELGELEHQLARATPLFEQLRGGKSLPMRVQFFEGMEGVKTIAEDTLKASTELCCIATPNVVRCLEERYLRYWIRKRDRLKLKQRTIWSEFYTIPDIRHRYNLVRLLPKGKTFETTLAIYDDKVAVFDTEPEPSAFLVQNAAFACGMRMFFEEFWKNGARVKKPKKK